MKQDSSALLERFNGMDRVTSRAMFGGFGIYKHKIIFALIIEGKLYFKVDEKIVADFEKAGSRPFEYQKENGKTVVMSYWLLPDKVLKNKETLLQWIDRSVDASKRKKSHLSKRARSCSGLRP
jgi:DNA transformation protein